MESLTVQKAIANRQSTIAHGVIDNRQSTIDQGPIGNLHVVPDPIGNRQPTIDLRQPAAVNCHSVARFVLVAALVVAPWTFGAVDPTGWVSLGIVASVVLMLWAIGSVQQGVLTLVWSPLYLPLAAFFILGVIQYAARLALDRAETRSALVLLAADLVFFFVATQLFATAGADTWRRFGLTVLVLAASLGLFAILQFADGEQKMFGVFDIGGTSFFGPYVNPNHFAGLMEMLVPVAVLYIAARRGAPSLAALAWLVTAAAIAVASLLLSGSRGGLLALAAETTIALALAVHSRRSLFRRSLGAVAAATVLAAALLFAWVDPGWVSKRLALVANVGGPAWTELADFRKSMALDSLRMWRAHPLLGVGLGNFETAYPGYQSFPSEMWMDYAHDDYVEALAETGLVGAVLMLAALAIFLRLAFVSGARGQGLGVREGIGNRGQGTGASEDGNRVSGVGSSKSRSRGFSLIPNPQPLVPSGVPWIKFGAALGCCGMLVHSFLDFNLHIPANAAWFAVLAGIASLPGPGGDNEANQSNAPGEYSR
jgi:O-antigen ligase